MHKNYQALDLMKMICAVLVIANHTSPFLPNYYWLNFIVIHIFARVVVPFYFFNSAYMIGLKDDDEHLYFKRTIKNLFNIYLKWSIIYLPIGVIALSSFVQITPLIAIGGIIVAFLVVGTYFHLWYLAAIIFALIVLYILITKLNIRLKYISIFAFILFMLGLIETYYGIFIDTPFQLSIDTYFNIFITTRNGIFFALIYIVLGYAFGKYNFFNKISDKQTKYYSLLFFILTVAEAFTCRLLFKPLNYNMLFFALPFTIVFYNFLLNYTPKLKHNYLFYRKYSSLLYFNHGFFLVLTPIFLDLINSNLWDNGMFKFISTITLSFILSFMVNYVSTKRQAKTIIKT